VLANAADFVDPLVFTNIKLIVAGCSTNVTINHSLILGFFSILCSCTTYCSKGTCSWSSDKLTVFHEERWEFQRSKIYLRFGQHTVLRIIYKLQGKFRNWRKLTSASTETICPWVQDTDFRYHVFIVLAKFATQPTVFAWSRVIPLLLVQSFSVCQWSVVC